MKLELKAHLGADEVAALSSEYIDEGVKKDFWKILSVDIDGMQLKARAKMVSWSVSPFDSGGFHLSIFSTQEILAQLANIFFHVAAGHKVKAQESWMRECLLTYRSVIRDPENIMVEMNGTALKKVGDSLIGTVTYRVTDDLGGLFTGRLKGLLR